MLENILLRMRINNAERPRLDRFAVCSPSDQPHVKKRKVVFVDIYCWKLVQYISRFVSSEIVSKSADQYVYFFAGLLHREEEIPPILPRRLALHLLIPAPPC